MKFITLRFEASKPDKALVSWLARQSDPESAIKLALAAYLDERKKKDAEILDLRHQVKVLCNVLDRVTGAGRPAGMTLGVPEPIRPIELPASLTARTQAAPAQEEGLRDQIDQKIGKLLDFGEI